MPNIITHKPVFKPEINFEVEELVQEERSTIVHCSLSITCLLRISQTTYLVQQNGDRKKLLQAYNIASFPDWKLVLPHHRFTLIFEGLDRDCQKFDLIEDVQELHPFEFKDIKRNNTDVYTLAYPNFPFD